MASAVNREDRSQEAPNNTLLSTEAIRKSFRYRAEQQARNFQPALVWVIPYTMLQPQAENRATLLEWIGHDKSLSNILLAVRKNDDGDAAHDAAHLLRVALWTMRLGAGTVDPREATAAALLHDLVNLPKNDPNRSRASEFSAEKALPLLKAEGFGEAACARIAAAIRDHSFSRGAKPTDALGQALQDADRLEALGAIGLMRVFATGARMGTKFFHEEDPWAVNRPLNDLQFSVDHFFTKLLKLPESFLTKGGQEEARRRALTLSDFLNQLSDELGEPRP
jgi:uncharacterized protein